MIQKSSLMDLVFDQLLNPHKTVRNPTDHRHIGMTTYYGIKFKNSKSVQVIEYALASTASDREGTKYQ